MKKKILVFLGLLVLFLLTVVLPSSPALAQEVNYAGSANNGVAFESSSTCYTSFDHIFRIVSCSTSGAVSNTNDGSTATYWKRQSYCSILRTADFIYSAFTIEITFDEVAPQINNVKYWIDWYNHTAYQESGLPSAHSYGRSLSVSLYYSGAWHPIGISQSSFVDISGSWSDVTKVRIYMYTWTDPHNNPSFGRMQAWASVTLYELEAWGSPSVVLPTVITNDATGIDKVSAILNGDITDTGGENSSERGFEWGTVSGGPYPNDAPDPLESGSFGTGTFSQTISGLNSETTYYFRAKAYNSAGWGYGEEKSVTTASPICGDGTLDLGELCDDNNNIDCDGCSGDCTRVDNVCGDWIVECGEECDDGNLINGDGCDLACGIELVPPCQNHNVWGWAYSENIGWISFSCQNCDSDLDGNLDGGSCGSGSSVDYGVDVDPVTGLFSGYAWSENIGWISFEPADVVGCPSGTCQASIDLGNGLVYGWAKALAAADGWDGWIGLSGIWADGVSVISNPSPPPASVFKGWAWGDVVVGWISFNDKDFDGLPGPVDYQVMTGVVINNPPYVESGSTDIQYEEGCNFSPIGRIGLAWTYQDDEGDQQDQYNLQIATDSGFNNLVVDAIINQNVLPGSDGTSAISEVQSPTIQIDDLDIAYGDSYFWRVRAKAATGSQVWSDWEEYNDPADPDGDGNPVTFTSPSNPYPKPSFTWYPLSPPAEVEVTFTDNSTCYTGATNCKDDVNTSYEWDFGDGSPIDNTKPDGVPITHTYLSVAPSPPGYYTVWLGVTDNIGGVQRTCYQEESLTATLPLPTWKEIIPF